MDHVVGAIFRAIAATDAGLIDKYFSGCRTMDGIRWAIAHAVGMFTMTAGCGHIDRRQRRAGTSVQPRRAAMGHCASCFAVITVDAEAFVDNEHIGGFTDALFNEKFRNVAGDRPVDEGFTFGDAGQEISFNDAAEFRGLVE